MNKNTVLKKIEEASEYKNYIITAIILFIVIFIAYKCSHSYRISKLIYDMNKMSNFLNIKSDLNKEEIRELNLGDFYISSAYRPYIGINQMFEYCDLSLTEKIIKSGTRCMYLDIFNSNMGYNAEPVLSTGYHNGQWKMTINTILFDDFCKMLAYMCFSAGYVNNYNDPFILLLNLNTGGNIECLNKIKRIIYKRFKKYLLDNRYTFSRKNIIKTPIKNLMKKMIIITSDGFQNSELEELINYNWGKEELKSITFESLDKSVLDPTVIKLDPYDLKNYNKSNMTIVTPNHHTVFTYNYDPSIYWNAGCQFVCMNYQKIDEHFDTYISKFKNDSFIAKPLKQRGNNVKQKLNIQKSATGGNSMMDKKNDVFNYQNERCPELPIENNDLEGSEMINYKDYGAQHGLCFPSESSKCHCDNVNDDSCYFYNYGTLNSKPLCCANNKIVNPSPIIEVIEQGQTTAVGYNPNKNKLSYISKTICKDKSGKLGESTDITLEDGKERFEKGANNYNKIYLCPIESHNSINNKHVCLIDQNNNNKCPQGWDYNAKIKDTNDTICCRNT